MDVSAIYDILNTFNVQNQLIQQSQPIQPIQQIEQQDIITNARVSLPYTSSIRARPIINVPLYTMHNNSQSSMHTQHNTIFQNTVIEPVESSSAFETPFWHHDEPSRTVSNSLESVNNDEIHKHNSSNILKKFFKRFHNITKSDKSHSPIITSGNSPAYVPNITPAMNTTLNFEDYKKLSWNKAISKTQEEKSNHQILIKQIETYKKKLTKDFFIISVKYDKICYKYNAISLTIMILSTVSTFIEAVRLTLTEYMKSNKESLLIDVDVFTLTINVFMLLLGTVITILSSIVRFKNYREIMEKLKNIQNMIIKYIILYNKQIDLIQCYNMKDTMDDNTFKEFSEKIKEYNKEIEYIIYI